MSFLRWFSTVVPIGTTIQVAGTAGDLADWEFEGNLADSSGHNLTLTSQAGPTGVAFPTTPAYPPACYAGTPQVYRAGFPAQLTGGLSQPLDGGTALTYTWQTVSGPNTPLFSSRTAANPRISGLVAGPYTFQLTVTDSSNQSTTCSVADGAVATDNNGVVITNSPSVDALLGQTLMWGSNPWPWFDKQNKELADLQIAGMDTNFADYWDTNADPGGTVAVTSGSAISGGNQHAFHDHAVPGCDGESRPCLKLSPSGMVLVLWHNHGANRMLNRPASCTDDTHVTMTDQTWWNESGMTYSASDSTVVYNWGWGQVSTPGNYYDNVAAYYSLYYRTGMATYLNAARKLADRVWSSPMLDQGGVPSDPDMGYLYTGRSHSLLGIVLRALDGRPDMWPGLRNMWSKAMQFLVLDPASQWGMWDQREVAYHLIETSYCAQYDPDSAWQSTCRTAIINSLAASGANAVWQPETASDGSLPALEFTGGGSQKGNGWNSYSTWNDNPLSCVDLTPGSVTVTGHNTHWTSAMFPANKIWFLKGTLGVDAHHNPALDNSTGESVMYQVASLQSATQLTLSTPYAGTLGRSANPVNCTSGANNGWAVVGPDDANSGWLAGYGNQPFMEGIQTVGYAMAAKALATASPSNSALALRLGTNLGSWLQKYGYADPAYGGTGGMYYFAGYVGCSYPVQTAACTVGFTPSQARTDAAEAVRGMMLIYQQTGDPNLKSFIDTVYSQMYSKPGTSAQFPGDGNYIADLDDAQSFMTGASSSNKWLGFFFGFDNGSAWPALRIGGLQIGSSRTSYVAYDLATVHGAARVQVTAMTPSGLSITTQCTSSPCAASIGGEPGGRLLNLQYLSATGAVLASNQAPILQDQ